MVVTLTGSNDFLRKHELDALVSDFLRKHDLMAIERLDGEETTSVRMVEAVSSLPFLTARKMVILRAPSKQKDFTENIVHVLENVAETTDLVLVEPKLDKRLTYYKTLKKNTDFRELGELDGRELAVWATRYAKEQGGELSAADARLLVDWLGANQQLLKSELDKLLGYNPKITHQTIHMLVERLPQSTIFELLDAAFQGRAAQALALYKEQRALKVEPQAILALIAWQLHVLAVIVAAGNRTPDDIAKIAKINPFVVRKSSGIARALSVPRLKQMTRDLLELDKKLKTVSIDADEALQLYLLQIAR